MSNILTVAYCVEGATDRRFLENIIQRTFEEIAFNSAIEIDVFPVTYLPSPKLGELAANVTDIAKDAFERGMQVLCVHADADANNDADALAHRINPAFEAVFAVNGDICKNLVAIIPVHMSESWMLADKDLFKEEINTTKSNAELGIARQPERIANPKKAIVDAIRIAQEVIPKKRRTLEIRDIYQPLGQNISLDALGQLNSYIQFRHGVIEAFRKLNYLH